MRRLVHNSTSLQIDKPRFLRYSTTLNTSLVRAESKSQVINYRGKRRAKLRLTPSLEVLAEYQGHY